MFLQINILLYILKIDEKKKKKRKSLHAIISMGDLFFVFANEMCKDEFQTFRETVFFLLCS